MVGDALLQPRKVEHDEATQDWLTVRRPCSHDDGRVKIANPIRDLAAAADEPGDDGVDLIGSALVHRARVFTNKSLREAEERMHVSTNHSPNPRIPAEATNG